MAASGLAVTASATSLGHLRWLYVLPNGDVLVAETNAPGSRPEDGKGIKGVAYRTVQEWAGAGVPSANRITLLHRENGREEASKSTFLENLNSSRDGSHLYATVGSNSNVGENGLDKEESRAAILEIDRATCKWRMFASGLGNPNGMDWEPQTGALWTVVNERDEFGSDLVPDYLTSWRVLRLALRLLRTARRYTRAG